MRHIIPISGKDSLCTAIVQKELEPELDYEYMFNPTGYELPEVFEWLDKCEIYLGKKIHRVGKDLGEIIKNEGRNGYFLPSRMNRYCTRKSKLKPMIEWIGDDDAKIYYGIRADEERPGFDAKSNDNLFPVYPLKTAGVTIDGVYRILNQHGLKPPTFFWKDIYERVCERLDFDPREVLPEFLFDQIFAWRTRANCDRCFNQRSYEIAGLWEHYPERAKDALWQESQGSKFSWREKPFDWYKENAESIKKRRVDKIVKFLTINQTMEDDLIDVFKTTSCGLLCGK